MSGVQHPGGRQRAARAFTLIELLVVVAIIALLISILLPSLIRAREQAKSTKCVAGLKQVANSMHMYFNEENDWFPWEKRNNMNYFHGFYYGGHPGRNIVYPHWWGYIDTTYRDTPGGRPFNRFLYPDMPTYDVQPTDPQFEVVRKMPVYECPSDHGGVWNTSNEEQTETIKTLYYEAGNSYDMNYPFCSMWAIGVRGGAGGRWMHLANAFTKRQLTKEAGMMIMTYEDPFDFAIQNRVQSRGWHKIWIKHNFTFLDGHAAAVETDTAKYKRGLSWKSCAGDTVGGGGPLVTPWWTTTTDPDYPLKDIAPLPGF